MRSHMSGSENRFVLEKKTIKANLNLFTQNKSCSKINIIKLITIYIMSVLNAWMSQVI